MRPFFIGVGLVLALLLGFNLGLPLFFPDITSPPRVNLEPKLETIASDTDALARFSVAAAKMNLRGIEPRIFLQPGNWIQSEAARLTGGNVDAMATFERGIAKNKSLSRARDPQFADFNAVNVAALPRDVKGWHQLGELVLLRANLYLKSGDAKSAWQDYFLVWRAAHLIRNGKGSLLELDVGDSLAQLALTQMRGAMRQSTFDDQTWRNLLKDLQNQAPDANALEESLKSERRFFTLALDAATGKTSGQNIRINVSSPIVRFIPSAYALQPGKTLETYTLWLEGILSRSRNCPEAKDAQSPTDPVFLNTNPLAANSVGNALLRSWIPPYGLATRTCKLTQAYRATQVSLALHATSALTEGVPPANIGVLEGRYFDKMPTDPFSGSNNGFQWDLNGKILRSEDGTGYSVEF
jgi:hypothetical protein